MGNTHLRGPWIPLFDLGSRWIPPGSHPGSHFSKRSMYPLKPMGKAKEGKGRKERERISEKGKEKKGIGKDEEGKTKAKERKRKGKGKEKAK